MYKNLNPIIKFGNSIYYMKVINDYVEKPDANTVQLSLCKYELGKHYDNAKKKAPDVVHEFSSQIVL